MSYSALPYLWLVMVANCNVPPAERRTLARQVDQGIASIGVWDMGCNNSGDCVAIGALPQASATDGSRLGALRIDLTHEEGLPHGFSILPLGAPSTDKAIGISPAQGERLLVQLQDGGNAQISVRGDDALTYSVPGKHFDRLITTLNEWHSNRAANVPSPNLMRRARIVALSLVSAPPLTLAQSIDCAAGLATRVSGAWEIGQSWRLFKYVCADVNESNPTSIWFTSITKSTELVPINLPEARGKALANGVAGLSNASFDAITGLLEFGWDNAPTGACGVRVTYVATQSGFTTVRKRGLMRCIGVSHSHWIETFQLNVLEP
jgi:hypothetical protein